MDLHRKDTAVTAVVIPVDPAWHGKALKGDNARAENLRQALLAAQRELIDSYDGNLPRTLHVGWFITINNEEFAWNPITPVPPAATSLVIRATTELFR